MTLHDIVLHYIALHCTTLCYIASHSIELHYITSHCVTLQCTTLHYIALHCITLHYITLHYITLHYITLHYIGEFRESTYDPAATGFADLAGAQPLVVVKSRLRLARPLSDKGNYLRPDDPRSPT